MTRDLWVKLTLEEKQAKIAEYLKVLDDIATGRHDLSIMDVQGRLVKIKQDIRTTLFNIFDWEREEHEKSSRNTPGN